MNRSTTLLMLALSAVSCVTICAKSTPNQANAAPVKKAGNKADDAVSQEFLTFWDKFKDALRKNDTNALAEMTKLPYLDDEKKLNKAEFIAKCGKIFPASTRKCLLREKPVSDKDCVMVFCGDSIFIFVKDQGKYKFSEIGVND